MIEAAMIWNEPNNKSHWDLVLDPGWKQFAGMASLAGRAIRADHPDLPRVLGGISPIDPGFLKTLEDQGVIDEIDIIAVHGFPLDWNLWQIDEWPAKIDEIRAVTQKPIWVTEVGISSFGAEEVQAWGVKRTARLLIGKAPRIHWYSLYDLLREDGSPKPALEAYAAFAGEMGLCQWFHFEDPRLENAVAWMKRLGVKHLRTGISWADSLRPQALDWFDRQMDALRDFQVTVTFCFTPEHRGVEPHHTSPPQVPEEFAAFCAEMTRRYAPPAQAARVKASTPAVA